MNISPQHLATALGGEASGDNVTAPGPNHSPTDRSLSIKLDPSAPDGMLVHSFAGDDPLACKDYIRERAGIPRWEPAKRRAQHMGQVSSRPSQPATPSKPAAYVYKLADGSPYLRVNRTASKRFWQEHWNGEAWIKGAPKGPKIPYRLPDILAVKHDDVVIVEGEKDADNLADLGFTATTNAGGAGNFAAELAEYFRGDVYIIPDNDESGASHAQQVAEVLMGVAKSVRIVALPDLPDKGDVSDWLAAGGTVEQLSDLMRYAPQIESIASKPKRLKATPFAWRDPQTIPRREFLYDMHLIRKFASAKFAAGGVGKSTLALTEAIAMATGSASSPPHGAAFGTGTVKTPAKRPNAKLRRYAYTSA